MGFLALGAGFVLLAATAFRLAAVVAAPSGPVFVLAAYTFAYGEIVVLSLALSPAHLVTTRWLLVTLAVVCTAPSRSFAEAEPGFRALLDGFRFAWMPDDRETWRLVARGLDEQARSRFGAATYAALDADGRHEICRLLAGGEPSDGVWDDLDAATAWSVVTRAILAAFYSHPWAWNEMGFAGPAYPRGYAALGENQRALEHAKQALTQAPDELNRKSLEGMVKALSEGQSIVQ